jgi:hypothetical protein
VIGLSSALRAVLEASVLTPGRFRRPVRATERPHNGSTRDWASSWTFSRALTSFHSRRGATARASLDVLREERFFEGSRPQVLVGAAPMCSRTESWPTKCQSKSARFPLRGGTFGI